MHIIYLHGFNSSPQSKKAALLADAVSLRDDIELVVPALPFEPMSAISTIQRCMEATAHEQVALIGSSLGGFYALYIAEKYHCRATLINPAIRPYELLADYLGKNINMYTGEQYVFTTAHISQLQDIEIQKIKFPQNYLVLLQTGDEILDYRQAVEKFNNSYVSVAQGGNHSFDGFEKVINDIIEFSQPAETPLGSLQSYESYNL